jgi:hypothetical protein
MEVIIPKNALGVRSDAAGDVEHTAAGAPEEWAPVRD